MAFKSGFFNSINQDRGYSNKDISKIFDGVIEDGVYSAIGNKLTVHSYENNTMSVYVDTGRAWFHHAWAENDSPYGLPIAPSSPVFNRIDAVVLEVNHSNDVRSCSLAVVNGEPATNPERPTLIKDEDQERWQEVLAYVRVNIGVTEITEQDIDNMVGTSVTPFVESPLTIYDIDILLRKWSIAWDEWLADQQQQVLDWFANIQTVLEPDVGAHLQNEIDNLNWGIQRLDERVTAAENKIVVGPEDISEHMDLPDGSIYFQYEE